MKDAFFGFRKRVGALKISLLSREEEISSVATSRWLVEDLEPHQGWEHPALMLKKELGGIAQSSFTFVIYTRKKISCIIGLGCIPAILSSAATEGSGELAADGGVAAMLCISFLPLVKNEKINPKSTKSSPEQSLLNLSGILSLRTVNWLKSFTAGLGSKTTLLQI